MSGSSGRKQSVAVMKYTPWLGISLFALAASTPSLGLNFGTGSNEAVAAESAKTLSQQEQSDLVNKYCMKCHNYDDNAGNVAFELFDPSSVASADNVEVTEEMVRKMRAGLMPPAGEPRPDFKTEQAMAESLEQAVDKTAVYHPGAIGLHRMNRTEYANAVRDLLGIDVDTSKLLPVDDSSSGFDNQAGTLGLSPVLLEAYITSAGKISRQAMGNDTTTLQVVYPVAPDETQDYHIDGLPFGTRGGLVFEHNFPADGKYTIKTFAVTLGNMGNFTPFGDVRGEQLEVLVDGQRVGLFDWDKEFKIGQRGGGFGSGGLKTIDITVPVTAGSHKVGVTFLARNFAPGLDLNHAFERSTIETGGIPGFTFYPHIGKVRIDGPFDATVPTVAPSEAKIFICHPTGAADEDSCARKIITSLARKAYRGFQTPDDIEALFNFYKTERGKTDFRDGIEAALQRVLSDPKFIYRIETPPRDVADGQVYKISDLALASRLSFFLWSSIPDDELLTTAETGRLSDPKVFEAQVKRMLADPKAKALTENFAGQWLALRNLRDHEPVASVFPDFDNNLRDAYLKEAQLFFNSLIQENRPASDLLTADYTFVNGRLAKEYGIPGIEGSRFQRVKLTGDLDARRGILGKGAILTAQSYPGRTSPVVRGHWVLEQIIGSPPPPPPPNVPAIPERKADAAGNAHVPTIRETFEAHRNNPACIGCHKMMDPIGFSLELFDAVGHWRTEDAGQPINAADVMYDGTHINGPADLRSFLVKYQHRVIANMTEKMMTYAVGRAMTYKDMPSVRAVFHQAAKDDFRMQSLILAVAESDAFQKSTKPVASQEARADDPGAASTTPAGKVDD